MNLVNILYNIKNYIK